MLQMYIMSAEKQNRDIYHGNNILRINILQIEAALSGPTLFINTKYIRIFYSVFNPVQIGFKLMQIFV